MELKTNDVKAGICFALIAVSSAILFVPIAEGAEEARAMFIMATALAIRDFFSGVQSDKRVAEVQQAYDPQPPESYVEGQR